MIPLAMLFFAQPALLIGLLAVALPILIHLLRRPRPQRIRFPAIALLWPALASGQRAGRVRNAALLCARIAIITPAVLLLAGPTCAPPRLSTSQTAGIAVALLIDDSASMWLESDSGRRLADLAREEAQRQLDALVFAGPAGVAVIYSGSDEPAPLESVDAARRRVRPVRELPTHARPLRRGLAAAARSLGSAPQSDRRLVVLTDNTARAWSDVASDTVGRVPGLSIEVVNVAPRTVPSNLALTALALPQQRLPANTPLTAAAEIFGAEPGRECWLMATTETGTMPRLGPLAAAGAGQPCVAEIALPPHAGGPHGLAVRLEPADRLAFDQGRFAIFETGPRPLVWFLTPDTTGSTDDELTSLILRNLLAPTALAPAAQLLKLATPTLAALAVGDREPRPTLIVVVGGTALPAAAAQSVLEQVELGATLLLVPNGGQGGAEWPGLRSTIAAVAPEERERAAATTLAWDRSSPYALEPDAPGNLAGAGVRRWLALSGLSESTVIHARYADGAPAIVSKPVGRGRVVLLTTSPDPAWSELGVEAAGLLTWLHALITEALGPPATVADFELGQRAEATFAALPPAGSVRVSGPAGPAARSTWVTLREGRPPAGWPTDAAGIYAIDLGAADAALCRYAVNWPRAESDLTPATPDTLRRFLGPDARVITLDDLRHADGAAEKMPLGEPRTWLGGLLLAALLIESWLAGRFALAPHAAR